MRRPRSRAIGLCIPTPSDGRELYPGERTLASPDGWTAWAARWKVVRLWDIAAADLLGQHNVGLIPWVPLTHFEGTPEALFTLCRERIDSDAPPDEHENLLVATQILASLRYNDPRLFSILGGKRAMIESPVLKEFLNEQICGIARGDPQLPQSAFRRRG